MRYPKNYTMIGLPVVIVIVGILASIAIQIMRGHIGETLSAFCTVM